MPIILYMAISADGFIAGPNDETPWSEEEWKVFQTFIKTCDKVLLGRRTYEIMRDQDEFVDGPEYIVVTNNAAFDAGKLRKQSIKAKADLPQTEKLGVIGGGELNGNLAEIGILDEVILDIEPVILGNGVRLFGGHDIRFNFELVESRRFGIGTMHHHYRVKDKLT